MKKEDVVAGETCFSIHMQHKTPCLKEDCRQWMLNVESQNCTLIAAQAGGMTLEQIGQLFGLTRMRVCQIEKNIYKKIIDQLNDHRL